MSPLLRQRDFVLGALGNLASATSETVIFVALLARVYELTHSSANLGVTAVLEALPAIALGPAIGRALDRTDRRYVMVAADAFNVAAALMLAHAHALWAIYAGALLLAVGGAAFRPANEAMQPALLPGGLFMQGACARTMLSNLRQIAAPALGGVLVSRWGFECAAWWAGLGYAASGLLTALIRTSGRAAGGAVAEESGWRAILDRPPVRFVATFQSLIVFVMAMQAPLTYVFVREVLGRGPEVAGTMFSAAGLGGIAGGLAMARWGGRVRDRLGLAMLTLGFDGLVLAAFACCSTPAQAVPLFSLFGIIGAVNGVVFQTVVQEEVPDALRGRVQGTLQTAYRTVEVLSLACGTLLADRIGVARVFAAAALLEVLVAVAARHLPSYRASLDPRLAPA